LGKTDFSIVEGIKLFKLIDMAAVRFSKDIDCDMLFNHYKNGHIPLNI